MFLVNALQVMCGRRVIAVSSRLRSLKFAYVSSGSHDLAGQAFLFLSGFLYSFFAPPISPVFSCTTKNLPDKEQKKEGLRRRLAEVIGGWSRLLINLQFFFVTFNSYVFAQKP